MMREMSEKIMKRISWSCLVIGVVSILLSFIGIFFPLDEKFIGFNLSFKSLIYSLYGTAIAVPKLGHYIDILRLPPFDYIFSLILVISGIGTILIKPWGRKIAYIYALSIILLSVINVPIAITGYIKEFIRINRNPSFMDGIIWGGVLIYIIAFPCALLYPIILLIFFSRPKIKEKFRSRKLMLQE